MRSASALRISTCGTPAFIPAPGEAKMAPEAAFKHLIIMRKSGAGEGIRTLDPNLGKVVLYP